MGADTVPESMLQVDAPEQPGKVMPTWEHTAAVTVVTHSHFLGLNEPPTSVFLCFCNTTWLQENCRQNESSKWLHSALFHRMIVAARAKPREAARWADLADLKTCFLRSSSVLTMDQPLQVLDLFVTPFQPQPHKYESAKKSCFGLPLLTWCPL